MSGWILFRSGKIFKFAANFFNIIALTLRQSATREFNIRVHLNLAFLAFFLTNLYESMITTDITVKPSPHIADLKELFVSRGYRMFWPTENPAEMKGHANLNEFRSGFATYNLSHLVDERIKGFDLPIKYGPAISDKFETFKNPGNKVATDVSKRGRGVYSSYVQGHGYEEIVRFLEMAREAGLVEFWREGQNYMDTYRNMKFQYGKSLRMGLIKGKWAAMGLNERVGQLFEICGAFIALGVILMVVEVISSCRKKGSNYSSK
ncbi:Dynein heavy chain, cytoplasmic [Folsomia candida]|uniref:Dynein heavy chain, cytoplasmic n=1 Tax=Folsomia candida TaxID=158441 RepID=A0A226EBD9_FOLCA|nr:Dynein heavy chain, cytoplasmic [Folsomia candida]